MFVTLEKGVKSLYPVPYMYPIPYYINVPVPITRQYPMHVHLPQLTGNSESPAMPYLNRQGSMVFNDHGNQPFVLNISEAAEQNETFRTAIWTGKHLQVTLMSIDVGEDIGLEVHPHVDQFLRIEEGQGLVQMGDEKSNLNYEKWVSDDFAIMVPAGTWHNVTNTGNTPLKLYSIYAPPEHPFGTVHRTKSDALLEE